MDKPSDSNQTQQLETAFEIKSLRKRLQEIEAENARLIKILKDNDLMEEVGEVAQKLTDEEYICVNELRKLKELSETSFLEEEDVRKLDILYKNLRAIRGMSPVEKDKKKKTADVKELFKIVEGSNG
jgi:hypothetical protein